MGENGNDVFAEEIIEIPGLAMFRLGHGDDAMGCFGNASLSP
jgi:hypothetical protein